MTIPFHVEKVVQAAAVLLKCEESRRMGRLRLLKLLYIADRERMTECCRPITGDKFVAMDHGPVLSQTYNLIKGTDILSPEWDKYIRTIGHRDVILEQDPGIGKLTRKEIAKLQEVSRRFEDEDDYQIAEHTHGFPEWIKNKPVAGSSNKISLDDLIEATGLSAVRDKLLADAANERLADQLLHSAGQP
jgi:uncharacterized phage-associated protein